MILLEKLEKTFAARAGGPPVPALRGVSLEVIRGEVFGIIGRSGAGKSTLIRTINLLEPPTAGRVLVDGVDMTGLGAAELRQARRQIGMIFQHFNLLSSRTVFGNVALPLELAGMRRAAIEDTVGPLLDLVGLTAQRDRYPAELSGGQKQRVGIARALASRPKVLLCDEATSALDPETTLSILRLLAEINRTLGLTIVLITHEMGVIKEICHRVAVMEAGRVIEEGPVFEVFTRPRDPITRAFVGSVVGGFTPEHVARRLLVDRPPGGATVLRIVFTGESANQPVISQLSRQFGLDLNLLHGQLDQIRGEPFGTLLVEAVGPTDQLQAAFAFLRAQSLTVEVLGHVPGDLRAFA